MATVYEMTLEQTLSVDADAIFAVLEAPERFHEFMPHVNRVTVMESLDAEITAHWETEIDGIPLEWIERAVYDRESGRIRFWALDGVFDRFDGVWEVTEIGPGSRISFSLCYEIGLPEIEPMVAPLLHTRLDESIRAMLASMEKGVGTAR